MSQGVNTSGLNATCNVQLSDDWYVPAKAILPYEDLSDEHWVWMATHSSKKRFSSRVSKGHHVYSSPHYWRRPMDTAQDSVYLFGILCTHGGTENCRPFLLLDVQPSEGLLCMPHKIICGSH
ncbi:hypothetical protein Q1695_009417 [Nippostrongylus brasiliensis]|nr:hypothetical protein Q1695_009417 [Nippostrongylus brasiliensis]